MRALRRLLDGVIGVVLGGLKWLVVPLSLLLFLQWPLRELVHGYSREANDLGQWLFALYVASSVTAATRRRLPLGGRRPRAALLGTHPHTLYCALGSSSRLLLGRSSLPSPRARQF